MIVDTGELISAGYVASDTGNYKVAVVMDHPSLIPGDIVTMREHNTNLILVRLSDHTLHNLRGDDGDYVLLVKEPK